MINPFALLTVPLLEAFVKHGKTYFIRQTYTRGREFLDEGIKDCFILTHYSDIGQAQHHLKAIGHDPNRFIYHWDNPEERQSLIAAAGQPEGSRVYSSVFVKDWRKHMTPNLKEKVKKYIDDTLGWRPGRGTMVDFKLFVNYGELYIQLKLRSQEVRVKLEVIEEPQSESYAISFTTTIESYNDLTETTIPSAIEQ